MSKVVMNKCGRQTPPPIEGTFWFVLISETASAKIFSEFSPTLRWVQLVLSPVNKLVEKVGENWWVKTGG